MSDPIPSLNAALEGRYRVERPLGEGGMATVYLAEDVRHGRQVALKVLRPDLAASIGPERFLQEVRITANLQHPHILPLYDSGEADGHLFYVMPYIEGESLKERLTREGELPIADAARILRDVVDALATAHAAGVVHRDIKPANIMLSGRHAIVADFGVAKALSEAKVEAQLTTVGTSLGTPAYMSPEQAAADETIDHRADVYAVGALAYELLAGRPPFTASSHRQVLMAHITQEPDPITDHRATVPAELAAAVMKCLEKKRADRWQRAEEFLPFLEAAMASSHGMTPVGSAPVRPVGRAPAHRKVAASVLGAVVVGAGAWWLGFGSFTDDPGPAEGAVQPEEQSIPRPPRIAVLGPAISGDDPELAFIAGQLQDAMRRSIRERAATVQIVDSADATQLIASHVRAGRDAVTIAVEVLGPDGEVLRAFDPARSSGDAATGAVSRAADAAAIAARILEFWEGDDYQLRFGSLPRTPSALDMLQNGATAFFEGRDSDAADYVFRAIELEPDWPAPYTLLRPSLGNAGRGREWTSEVDSAFWSLGEKITLDERLFMEWASGPTIADRIEAGERRFRRSDGGFNTGYALAFRAINGNEIRLAREGMDRANWGHRVVRDWWLTWGMDALVYHLLGNHDLELKRARDGRRRFPDEVSLLRDEARALIALDSMDAARELFGELEHWPEDPHEVWHVMAQLAVEVRFHQGPTAAEGLVDAMAAFGEKHPDLDSLDVAHALYLDGRYAQALPILEAQATTRTGGNQLSAIALAALSLQSMGRLEEADEYERDLAALTDGRSIWGRRWYAAVAAHRGDTEETVRRLRTAFGDEMSYYAFGRVDDLFLHNRPEFEQVRDERAFRSLMDPR